MRESSPEWREEAQKEAGLQCGCRLGPLGPASFSAHLLMASPPPGSFAPSTKLVTVPHELPPA